MPQSTVTDFLSKLDLTSPADLAIAFHHFRNWPVIRNLDAESFTALATPLFEHADKIFGRPDHAETAQLVRAFIYELGGSEIIDAETVSPCAPREWLCVFREAFGRGLIGPVAFGAAVRMFLIQTGGNGAPGCPANSLAARQLMLADAKVACPSSLMTGKERHFLANLPDTLTVFRGGCYLGESPMERAKAMHWALDREYARSYAHGRAGELTAHAASRYAGSMNASTPKHVLEATLSRIDGQLAAIQEGKFVITANIPKSLLIAYIAAGPMGNEVEVWVDFEKLETDMLMLETGIANRIAA